MGTKTGLGALFGNDPPTGPPPVPVVRTTPFNFWDTPLGRQMMGLPPEPPPLWKPVYQPAATVSEPNNAGGVNTQSIKSQYLLSVASAYFLAGTYGAEVTTQAFEGAGGPVASEAVEYMLNWVDTSTGTAVPYSLNSGVLAYYYCPAGGVPSPGALANPDIVVAECNAAINAARMDALRLVR